MSRLIEHITFIVPPMLSTFDNSFYVGRKGGPPLNIAYLAAITENNNLNYDVIDGLESNRLTPFSAKDGYKLHGLTLKEIVSQINSETSCVAITSMFTTEWLIVRELSILIKEKFPEILIIIGGEHATGDAKNIIKYESAIDICFLGEAEISFDLFLKLDKSDSFDKIPGVVYSESNDHLIETAKAPRLTNLDLLKPSWKKININYYLDNKLSYSELGNRTMPIISSRGCPYQCTFCSNANMWGTRYVTRSVDKIISELRLYIEDYGVEHFDFIDLATSVNRTWFKELLTKMIEDLPKFTWEMTVGTRSEILDKEILDLLYRSGSTVLSYAPETGSKSMAKKIKKRIKHHKLYESVNFAINRGFVVKANVIIGFPNETFLELLATLWMSLKLGWMGVKGVTILSYQPFLGTELSKDLYQEKSVDEYVKRITDQTGQEGAATFSITSFFKNPKVESYTFISNSFMVLSYLLACVKRPKNIYISFTNVVKGKPISAIEVAIYSIFKKN